MIQAKMANMYTTLNASRSYVYNVARSLDRGERQNNVRYSESMNLSLKTTKYINILVCTFPGIVVHSYFVGRVYTLIIIHLIIIVGLCGSDPVHS